MFLSTCLIVLLLIAINALYVAAEFAAVSARHNQVRQLAEQGNTIAARLLPWIEDPRRLDQFISASQIGITLSSLVLGAYGQATLGVLLSAFLEDWAGLQHIGAQSASAVVVLIVLSTLQVVLGELVPKSIALQFSTQTLLLTFVPMLWSLWLFSLLIRVLNGSAVAILKVLGVPYAAHRHIHSPDEIELLIAESRDGGVLEPDEHMRLHQALQLGTKTVRQLMVPRRYMAAIDANTPAQEILQHVSDSPYSHIPVYKGSIDNVIGILHMKDVVLRLIEKQDIGNIRDIMHPVMIVPESVAADTLVASMRRQHRLQAIVVDEFGGTEGLITLEDVLNEMLGEVADEFKADKPQPERLPDGRVRLPGLMRLDEVEPWLGVPWQGDANTISGHIVEVLGYFPAAGEHLTIDGIAVHIEEVEHNTITSLIATPVGETE